MFKNEKYINAGTNEFYRYGHKAQEKIADCLIAKNGWYSINTNGGDYWTLGTSNGKYGEFAKFDGTFFSVNEKGFICVKEDSDKAEAFKSMINSLLNAMKKENEERISK